MASVFVFDCQPSCPRLLSAPHRYLVSLIIQAALWAALYAKLHPLLCLKRDLY